MKEKLSNQQINEIIDALLDLRLALSIKKISFADNNRPPTIKKSELKIMIEDINKKQKDEKVIEYINDVFAEYFDKKEIKEDNQSMTILEIEKFLDDETRFKEKTLEMASEFGTSSN